MCEVAGELERKVAALTESTATCWRERRYWQQRYDALASAAREVKRVYVTSGRMKDSARIMDPPMDALAATLTEGEKP